MIIKFLTFLNFSGIVNIWVKWRNQYEQTRVGVCVCGSHWSNYFLLLPTSNVLRSRHRNAKVAMHDLSSKAIQIGTKGT